jgi:hypothetical protein
MIFFCSMAPDQVLYDQAGLGRGIVGRGIILYNMEVRS